MILFPRNEEIMSKDRKRLWKNLAVLHVYSARFNYEIIHDVHDISSLDLNKHDKLPTVVDHDQQPVMWIDDEGNLYVLCENENKQCTFEEVAYWIENGYDPVSEKGVNSLVNRVLFMRP